MKKKLIVVVALVLMIAGGASANNLDWGSFVEVTNHLGQVLDNSAVTFSNGVTALVQLIYAGANGLRDTPYLGNGMSPTNGAGGDDQVVAFSFDGKFDESPGLFTLAASAGGTGYNNPLPNGSKYYVRVWELPEVAGSSNIVKIAGNGTNYYGDGSLYTISKFTANLPEPTPALANGVSTSSFVVTAIPEPGSLQLLMFLGTAFAMRRRMRKTIG